MSEPSQTLLFSFLWALQPMLRTAARPDSDPVATRDALALAERVLQRLLVEASNASDGNQGAVQQCEPLTQAALRSYLQQRYPDAGLQILAIRELAGGRSKRTLMISLLPNAVLPANLVLRQDKPASAQRTSVRDEYPALRALHGAAVPVAEPLWLEAEANSLGAAFLVMRWLPGSAPGNYWSAAGVSVALGRALAQFLATLHRVRCADVWPDAPPQAQRAVATMLEQLESSWLTTDIERPVAAQRGFAALRAQLPCIGGDSAAVHGDVHFGNVLAAGDRLVCVTDWEFAHAGHPAEDLAFCRSSIETIMPWSDFLAEYRSAGGPEVSERQLRFFRIWSYLRNFCFATMLRDRLAGGASADMQSLMIAVDARPRLEALLLQALADETTPTAI